MANARTPSYKWNVDWVELLLSVALVAIFVITLVATSPPSHRAGASTSRSTTTTTTTHAGTGKAHSGTTSTTTTTTLPTASAVPAKITVEVLNGNGIEHSAASVASVLSAHGFHIKSTGNADSSDFHRNLIQYAPNSMVSAKSVERYVVGASVLEVDSSLQLNNVLVTVGATNYESN